MTFLFVLFALISVILWIISIIFNDIEDGLQYYYGVSIFDWIPKDSWWSWYMQDPDDTWKRKYNWDDQGNRLGRKKWMGIPIHALFYDGWHGAKVLRQFFQYLTVFTGVLAGGYLEVGLATLFVIFVAGVIVYGVTNSLTHSVYVFGGVIRKDWWIERGKEQVIKDWLKKHFGK